MYYSERKTKALRSFEKILNGALGKVAASLHDGPMFELEENRVPHNFFKGSDTFLDSPAKDARWKLGYAAASLVPDDWRTHDYYLGGYMVAQNKFLNKVESVVDDMRVRCIAVDDGSERGVNLFAVIDCIGFVNADIRRIREKLLGALTDSGNDIKISSVNVCSTHTHSCIDTEGLWTGGVGKIVRNFRTNRKGGFPERGTDGKYIDFLINTVCEAFLNALSSMTPGRLTLAQSDIGTAYFGNRNRPSASAVDSRLTRLVFYPDNDSSPTIIASIAAHPDCAGLATSDGSGTGREISGEYIYYCDEFLKRAGYNFIFFNGAICALYMDRGPSNDGLPLFHRYEQSERYGVELAKQILSMNLSAEEILKDPLLSDKVNEKRDRALAESVGGTYTAWYEGHRSVIETELPPLLNIKLAEVAIKCKNPIILLAGKLNLTDFNVIRSADGYKIYTEIGYMTLGTGDDILRVAMVPGEFCCDLLKGGSSLTAQGSFSGTAFGHRTLWQILGEGTVCIGLANDAIGYIVPDNDYVLGDFSNHYHEILSLGRETGSTITEAFEKL